MSITASDGHRCPSLLTMDIIPKYFFARGWGGWHKKNFRPHLGEYFFLSRPSWPRFTPPRKSEVATQHTHYLVFTLLFHQLFQSLVDTNGTTNINFLVNENYFPVNENCFPINETIWLFIGSISALLEIFLSCNFHPWGSWSLVTSSRWGRIFF